MPIIKSAKKKLKQDKKRRVQNLKYKESYKKALKTIKKVSETFSAIDKAAKKGVIHKKKASRLKSQVSKRRHEK